MAGITPVEGQDYIAEVLYSQDASPGTLLMGLFTNVTDDLTVASEWGDISEPSGSGYSEMTLTPGSWNVASGGVATFPQINWVASADWAGDIYGYYVRTQEGTPRVLHFEYSTTGAREMTEGNVYTVDLSTNTETA